MKKLLPLALACSIGVGADRVADASTPTSFPAGSLILPSSASFQTDCGGVSVYGLVYDILRANAWLYAHGYGKITVYYTIADSTASAWSTSGKQSPNRCTPTDLNTAPTGSASWTDGCDIQLTGAAPLVKAINYSDTSTTGDQSITTFDTTNGGSRGGHLWPRYAAVNASSAGIVRYQGGPFVVSSAPNGYTLGSDSATLLALLQGTITAKDSNNQNIDFSPFTSGKPSSANTEGTCHYGTDNYVYIHRAIGAFSAPVNKTFNNPPPRIALLDSGAGGTTTTWGIDVIGEVGSTGNVGVSSTAGLAVGNTVTISNVGHGWNGTYTITYVGVWPSAPYAGKPYFSFAAPATGLGLYTKGKVTKTVSEGTNTISGGILDNYLNTAGLSFNGAQGCPLGGLNVLNTGLCPIGGNAGQIYDAFDFQDLAAGLLSLLELGQPRYSMIWTPHWDTTAGPSSFPNLTELLALLNIKTFVNGTNSTGLFAECASVSSYEGVNDSGSSSRQYGFQTQTCHDGGGGVCDATTPVFGTVRNMSAVPANGTNLHNCSDVDLNDGAKCAYYGYPQDAYAQVSDWLFAPQNGETMNWKPATSMVYQPTVLPLVSAVNNLVRANLTSPATMRTTNTITADWFTRQVKGNSNIAYLGGHDLTGNVAATRMVLQTLLQLGTATATINYVTTDASRNAPIAATLNSTDYIFQGTWENVQPVPPISLANSDAAAPGFTFPQFKGHMRATLASSIGTTAQNFVDGATYFDAHDGIPAGANGCAQPYDTTCRGLFTTVTATSATTGLVQSPTMYAFDDGNEPTIGPLISTGLNSTSRTTVMHTVRSAQLGGVDRSTVAVVPVSNAVGTSRPTMAYFGATDGMMHAVCADDISPCHKGKELWAFMPRTQLGYIVTNTTRLDGSPHVEDVFGAFGASTKSFHTILTFQTGAGTVTVPAQAPAIIAMDVTDPARPKVLWERAAKTGVSAVANDVGVGLAMGGGVVQIAGQNLPLAFAASNNGGANGAGTAGLVITALDYETGNTRWQIGKPYPAMRNASLIPGSAIPGGAVAVNQQTSQAYITDVVAGDIYGNLWQLNATDGTSHFTSGLQAFQYNSDYHPIGAMPAIYANGTNQFAAFTTGGMVDPSDTWGAVTMPAQKAIGIALNLPKTQSTFLNETSTLLDFNINLGQDASGKKFGSNSQILIVNGTLYISSDSSDTNNATYGTHGQTGQVTTFTIGQASSTATSQTVTGGASSLANVGSTVYTGSSTQQQQLATAAGGTGTTVDQSNQPRLTRNLWLRTM